MQKENKFYLGIDVSKLWFDVAMIIVQNDERQPMLAERFDNNADGLCNFNRWLSHYGGTGNKDSLIVIENTGVYHRLIWEYCSLNDLSIHIANAAQIKWSLGIVRGKNDVADSHRLCSYCYRHAEDLKATPALNPDFLKLKDLLSARSRLVSQLRSTEVYLKELRLSNTKEVQKIMEQTHKAALQGLNKSLKQIEEQIHKTIKKNDAIKSNYDLLLSVPGIGHLTATYLICCTNNFAGKISGKQLASYAGVVPFSNSSGTSIKGRNKVHKMANKELKKMLHLCAITAVRSYPEFKQYFDRKKAEGKHGMTIINAVRNKIILRAVAVVNNQKKYVDNYQKTA